MTNAEQQALAPENEQAFDSHRFSAEPKKRKGNRKVVALGLSFLVLMAAILIASYIGKSRLDEWRKERAAAQLEKNKASESANTRKGRTFDPEPAPVPAPAALPQTFNQPAPSPATPALPGALTTNLPPPPIPGTGAGTVPVAPVISMMLGDEEKAAKPAAQRGTVEELAAKNALADPVTLTTQASATKLGNRSFLIARGAYIPCILETQLNSNVPGEASCILPENIYSDNGKRLLLERGSTVSGSYGNTMKNGDSRIGVMWKRIKSADGNVVDVDSQAADGVGTMGIDGYVDNHWGQRLGAAILVSLISDAFEIAKNKQNEGGVNNYYGGNTADTSKSMSQKVLETTVNIPPTLSRNRGARLMIYVNKDLWFNTVYGEEE